MNQVLDISRKIWDALNTDDTETLKELVHEDAMFVHMGVSLKRDDEIAYMQKGMIVPQSVDFEESTVQDFGTAVVVWNKVKVTALVHGEKAVNPFVVTEVYSKENDSLRLIAWSYTKINY